MGYCPSGRLFESAACGVPVLSDTWEGLDQFFVPGKEIILAETADQAVNAIELSDRELQQISKAARARTLTHHTAEIRAQELERILDAATRPCVPSISKAASARDIELRNERTVWGICPAAGAGTRIQPLAFSKELLPIGSYQDCETERPRAVSEFLIERMVLGGATRLCFVISPGKNDIISYYGGSYGPAQICYTVQPKPAGLCDALFRAAPFVRADDLVLVGLPDTIWFPEEGFHLLHNRMLSFLLFPVEHPEYFDAVVHDEKSRVTEIQVKKKDASSTWVWGAFKLPGEVFHRLYHLWCERGKNDEYLGTLVNAYIAEGGEVVASRFGTTYSDVGTLHGYREAVTVLQKRAG
ncbi:MAG TPA: hypothetical protein DCS07_09395 [Bdellovibrionales bacterium]|nr:hypothetical protein [Bdellovibrionales bacterium]